MTEWDVSYDAFQLPNKAIPTWTKGTNFNATTEEISPAGCLHLISNSSGVITYLRDDTSLDNSVGLTFEFRLKLVSGYTYAQQIAAPEVHLRDGSYSLYLEVYTDMLEFYDGQNPIDTYPMDTTDGYHIYRITLKNNQVNVYVDGVLVKSYTVTQTVAIKQIRFSGDAWQGGGVVTSWDYVRYSTKGAFSLGGTAGESLGNPC